MGTDTDRLNAWVLAVNDDAECLHIGQFSHFSADAHSADWRVRVHFSAGVLRIVEGGETLPSGDLFELRGSASAWHDLADRNAPARRHDLLALMKADDGIDVVEGRMELIRHLRVVTRLVEIGKDRVE
ncbi:hypothetical protein [Cryobacterium sp. N19]|uniref:hypothetical protein n=1 Tax=Cryobacterium sp. N19 TaxID=2048288 RepID=UPI000CE38EE9|nr:hypothetical protein [Cryobacterium sp. N19]